jgi:hypothetical protein
LLIDKADYAFDPKRRFDQAMRSFFRFGRPLPAVDNRAILKDSFFLDLHIPLYVENWPEQPGPPHPGIFEDTFPTILKLVAGNDSVLTLHLECSDPGYFDELSFVRDFLAPHRIDYVLLPTRLEPQYRNDMGSLLFEWPLDSLDYIVDHWFMSPQIAIEGYSSRRSCLGRLADLYFQSYNAEAILDLLKILEFGFKVWDDNNGLFILSDKLDEDAVRARLNNEELDTVLAASILAARLEQSRERPT